MVAPLLFHLTQSSENKKTGPIPVSTSSAALCPASCPFNHGGGCYGTAGPLALHWRAVTDGRRGVSWADFLQLIRRLPARQIWRHNQVGDIADPGTAAGAADLRALVDANRGRRGFTFTHHPMGAAAAAAVRSATAHGFTVNASTESIEAADRMVSRGLRAVVVVPSTDTRRIWRSPDGNPVLTCPAQLRPGVITCSTCQLCHSRDQAVIVAFRAHGSGHARVDARLPAAASSIPVQS